LFSSRTPLEVKILEDYIKDWKESRGGILLFPKDHLHFDMLLLQNRFVLFDRLLDSSGTIELVPEEKMDEDSKRLYQVMVELQCELSWAGFLKRTPYFRSYEGIARLKRYIPGLNVNNKLTDTLNSSDDVLGLLQKIRPRDLYVILSTFTYPLGSEDNPVRSHVSSYHNPPEIAWVISMSISGSRLGGHKKRLVNMCKLLDAVAEIILQLASSWLSA